MGMEGFGMSKGQEDNYEQWYEEAIIASNELGYSCMSAADVIRLMGEELKAARQQAPAEQDKCKCDGLCVQRGLASDEVSKDCKAVYPQSDLKKEVKAFINELSDRAPVAPAEQEPVQYGYQALFNAIADAVKVVGNSNVAISVQAFKDSLAGSPAPAQPVTDTAALERVEELEGLLRSIADAAEQECSMYLDPHVDRVRAALAKHGEKG